MNNMTREHENTHIKTCSSAT